MFGEKMGHSAVADAGWGGKLWASKRCSLSLRCEEGARVVWECGAVKN